MFNLIATTHQNHCKEEASKVDSDSFDRVLIVSGDGLLNEYVNGILENKAWKKLCQKPLGILPAGSGNAIASVAGHFADHRAAALSFIQGFSFFFSGEFIAGTFRSLDLCSVFLRGPEGWKFDRFATGAILWTIVCDVDLGSEHLRMLGYARFDIYGAYKIFTLKRYEGYELSQSFSSN